MQSPDDASLRPGEAELVDLLAHLFRRADWERIGGGGKRVTFWGSRILVASRAGTIGEMVNRLANTLLITVLPAEAIPLMDACRQHEQALLRLLATEHVQIATRSYLRARELSQQRFEPKAADVVEEVVS